MMTIQPSPLQEPTQEIDPPLVSTLGLHEKGPEILRQLLDEAEGRETIESFSVALVSTRVWRKYRDGRLRQFACGR
jgi:hypothetical protein